MQNKKYTFRVARDANKIEIKNAVEEIFKVEVDKVTTINMKSKPKRLGPFRGKHECVEKGHREAVGRLQDHRVLRQPDVKRKESDNGNEDI